MLPRLTKKEKKKDAREKALLKKTLRTQPYGRTFSYTMVSSLKQNESTYLT